MGDFTDETIENCKRAMEACEALRAGFVGTPYENKFLELIKLFDIVSKIAEKVDPHGPTSAEDMALVIEPSRQRRIKHRK